MDTIKEGDNGIFFNDNSVEALMDAVKAMESRKYDFIPHKIRQHALNFDKKVFIERFKKFVLEKYSDFRHA